MTTKLLASGRARARDILGGVSRHAATERVVDALARIDPADGADTLAVLAYHRVDDTRPDDRRDPALISTTPSDFEHQLTHLARHRPIVSLADVLQAEQSGASLPPGAVLVTFDDAYRDFLDNAWPVLRRHGIPVTVFVPTAYPDHPERAFWWDRLFAALQGTARRDVLDTPAGALSLETAPDRRRAMERLRAWVNETPHDDLGPALDAIVGALDAPPVGSDVLGWDELRSLARQGVSFGAHTRTHPLMGRLPVDRAVGEALGSYEDLVRELGDCLPALAYPGGSWSQDITGALRESDITMAFTMDRGGNDLRAADRLALRRINVGRRSSAAALVVQTLPRAARSPRMRRTIDRVLSSG